MTKTGVPLKDLPPDAQKSLRRRFGVRESVSREKVVRLASEALRAVAMSEEKVATQRRAIALTLKWLGK